ncbi:MAG: N-acetyltransferase, partial [Deinococcota bacterium]
MADITLRNFEPADKAAVIELWNAHLGSEHPLTLGLLEQALEAETPEGWFIVAVDAHELVGFIWAKPSGWWVNTTAKAHLCGLAVAPARCRQGIGSLLWDTLIARLQAKGIGQLR